jgi:hypothetical protein
VPGAGPRDAREVACVRGTMALFTMYWPDWMCAAAREHGLEGQPLTIVWGGHNHDTSFARFKVGVGDTLVPVTCVSGVVYVLASLVVLAKSNAALWLPAHPEHAHTRLPGCGNEVLVGTPQASLRFDRPLSPAQLMAWRYATSTGERPLKFLRQGRLTRTMSMQGVYRVTEATRAVLASEPQAHRQQRPPPHRHDSCDSTPTRSARPTHLRAPATRAPAPRRRCA